MVIMVMRAMQTARHGKGTLAQPLRNCQMHVSTTPPGKTRARLPAIGVLVALWASGYTPLVQPSDEAMTPLRFEVSISPGTHPGVLTGRVFVMLSQTADREPRFQVGRTGVPFFGRDVEGHAPGVSIVIDATDLGSPIESLTDLPPGTYFVQALTLPGHVLRAGDGQRLF